MSEITDGYIQDVKICRDELAGLETALLKEYGGLVRAGRAECQERIAALFSAVSQAKECMDEAMVLVWPVGPVKP